MTSWISQHFLNSALFWPGLALLLVPIIIHLINRLRFRRVRFAAMEFLLASQKRNRRRILIEQLLLLLMRVGLILLVVFLISRLILDPDQLSVFQGARAHHIIVLDDSASMQDRVNDATAFETAKDMLRRVVVEGARHPGTQLLTLVMMSEPEKTVAGMSGRMVDESLVAELTERLETLECTNRAVDPAVALEAVKRRLQGDRASVRHVHILSDFRKLDWIDNKGAAALLKELAAGEVKVNLVRCVGETHENLAVSDLGGAVEVAAAGVPVSLSATVRNWGTREANSVAGSIYVDGQRLPRTLDFQTVPPRGESTRRFDVVFPTAEPHSVRVALDGDPFEPDNSRYLAVDVPDRNPVLIVDGSPALEQAQYLADALAADRSVTGFAPDLRTPEEARQIVLANYPLVYLVNVPELAADTVAELENYVRDGGGLVWYMGDAVRPAFYNEQLFKPDSGLFPMLLGLAPEQLTVPAPGSGGQIDAKNHPLFSILTAGEVPILDQVIVNLMYPAARPADGSPTLTRDVTVVAAIGGQPFMLEHRYGAGSVFTCLSSAGPLKSPSGLVWTNWANGPVGFSFVVFQLELAKRLVRKNQSAPPLDTGAAIDLRFDQAEYLPEVEVIAPDERVTRLQAAPPESPAGDASAPATIVETVFRETDAPGVYTVILNGQNQQPSRRLYAVSVPSREGALEVIEESQLLADVGNHPEIRIQPAGSTDWIRSESPGSEVRQVLLALLALLCIGEQLLASRLSYRG